MRARVDDWHHIRYAATIVQAVPGVVGVNNRIKQMNCFLFEIVSSLFEIACVFLEAFCFKLLVLSADS